MAGENEKDYTEISRSELEKIAGEIKKIEEHTERIDEIRKAVSGYHKSPKLDKEHRAGVMELLDPVGEKYKEMWGLYSKLDKEHGKEGTLEESVAENWLKKFADQIMPAMKSGVEGETMHNFTVLSFYLAKYDRITGAGEDETLRRVKSLISQGHGAEASAMIIGAIRSVKKSDELHHFMDLLIPREDHALIDKAAEKIANEAGEYAAKQGLGVKISAKKIGNNLPVYFQHYARGNMEYVINNAGIKKEKEEGKILKGEFGAEEKRKAA